MDIKLTIGAWYGDNTLSIKVPENSDVKFLWPKNMEGISPERIHSILENRLNSLAFHEKLRGKKSVCIVVDDITRPTPVQYTLEILIEKISSFISQDNIIILLANGAHKPMTKGEITKKIGKYLLKNYKVYNHDFMGEDINHLDDLMHGPLQLNGHFLDADVKITVGGVLPHNETGFGGGAKLIIPGIAGVDTISFFHGALPPRKLGEMNGDKRIDRRRWAEEVAKHVGVDLSIFILINSDRDPVNVIVGDIIEAHKIASNECQRIASTPIAKMDIVQADLCIINCYPLDSDPIQMGKALLSIRKYFKKKIVVINRASDGIFYHGMGMGSGIDYKRLLNNSKKIFQLESMRRYLKTIWSLLLKPSLLSRYSYFYFNALAYSDYVAKREDPVNIMRADQDSDLIIYSQNFPAFGLRQKYPKAILIRDSSKLEEYLSEVAKNKKIIVLPCAPLQILNISSN